MTEQGSESASDEDDAYREEQQLKFYCIVCEKHFKSQKAQENHERSVSLGDQGCLQHLGGNERWLR